MITTARTGTAATFVDSAGVLRTAAANTPRVTYDPVTLACLGLMQEPARTNVLLNSLIDGTPLPTQSVTVTAVRYGLSFYGTGSITLSGASTGTLAGAGAFPARAVLYFTPSAGTLTLAVSGSVQYAQLEVMESTTATASSFIPTAGTAVTRPADIHTLALPAAWAGGNGSILVDADVLGVPTTAMRLYEIPSGSALWQTNSVRNVARGAVTLAPPATGAVPGRHTIAAAYESGGAFRASADGGAVVSGTDATAISSSAIVLGNRAAGDRAAHMLIRRVVVDSRAWSVAELPAWSA